ncbi:hypothetical protein C8E87_1615 [Paractinoplanes brasiliensis]|uniref:Uncharacterized protein n=2 Tax=Paractinoplanes brasiliensis TaxID=52695 RepID=A0A4R6JTE3_9ACTN|nr:hypothetical protein C8E87_1615 [Actinoplanes brasiliensis]
MDPRGSNKGEVLQALFTATAPPNRQIPLLDADDAQNVVWLDESLARQALGRKFATLITEPVSQIVRFRQFA